MAGDARDEDSDSKRNQKDRDEEQLQQEGSDEDDAEGEEQTSTELDEEHDAETTKDMRDSSQEDQDERKAQGEKGADAQDQVQVQVGHIVPAVASGTEEDGKEKDLQQSTEEANVEEDMKVKRPQCESWFGESATMSPSPRPSPSASSPRLSSARFPLATAAASEAAEAAAASSRCCGLEGKQAKEKGATAAAALRCASPLRRRTPAGCCEGCKVELDSPRALKEELKRSREQLKSLQRGLPPMILRLLDKLGRVERTAARWRWSKLSFTSPLHLRSCGVVPEAGVAEPVPAPDRLSLQVPSPPPSLQSQAGEVEPSPRQRAPPPGAFASHEAKFIEDRRRLVLDQLVSLGMLNGKELDATIEMVQLISSLQAELGGLSSASKRRLGTAMVATASEVATFEALRSELF